MRRQPARLYADTSVFGGVFDAKFASDSAKLLAEIEAGRFELVTSVVVRDEVMRGPEQVRALFSRYAAMAEVVEPSDEILALAEAYVRAGVVTENWGADAFHVAAATITGCAIIASWNFRHIVHVDKAPRYNAVNRLHGYPEVLIGSPPEVIRYETEEGV